MARKPKRKIRVFWKVGKGEEQCVDVLAPVITLNAVMINRRLKKAGLGEIVSLVSQDGAGWIEYDAAVATYEAARKFFTEHPESLPFSDMVEEAISDLLEALGKIDNEAQLRFCTVE